MKGFLFTKPLPADDAAEPFEKLFNIFKELLLITGGDVTETLDWLNELDRQYKLTDGQYGMGDFIDDLKKEGYISQEDPASPTFMPSAKTERILRSSALEEIFGKLKKSSQGNHNPPFTGPGDEALPDLRDFRFGDSPEQIAMSESMRNAQINHGIEHFTITEGDLQVQEKEFKTNTSTVLMIDISHSMILYGEDRITPAKKVAMALAEFITTKYPKDTLDILAFGNDAWRINIKDLPWLQVGPYHTNTVAGLELAMDILRRHKNKNKQILMITDGKPTCLKEGLRYYKNSFGLDSKIINRVMNLGAQARRLSIPVTTFMIASDPYLKQFVHQFTEVNQGRAYYSTPGNLGKFMMEDFLRNRRRQA